VIVAVCGMGEAAESVWRRVRGGAGEREAGVNGMGAPGLGAQWCARRFPARSGPRVGAPPGKAKAVAATRRPR